MHTDTTGEEVIMARGKYGQSAATRHELEDRDAKIATYQHAVARLTAENKQLKTTITDERKKAAQVQRELIARLDLGLSPKVEALNMELAQVKKQRDKRMQQVRQFGIQSYDATNAIADLLVIIGWDYDAAFERAAEILPLCTGHRNSQGDLVLDGRGGNAVVDGRRMKFLALDTHSAGLHDGATTRATFGDGKALEMVRALRDARGPGVEHTRESLMRRWAPGAPAEVDS